MQRVVCGELGSPELLTVVEEETPAPGPGEVLVAVEAAGVSFVDGLIVQGRYQSHPPLPFTPGSAVAGRVMAAGTGVESLEVGTAVAGLLMGFGAYSSHVLLPEKRAVALPDAVSAAVAATAIESYSTLLFAATHRVAIAAGEWVVVLGAGGGIGLAAVDVASGLRARVLGVASSAAKRAAALAAGAEVVIDYASLKERIREITGSGADVVVDPVGGSASESALRALRAGGRFCVLGFASGEIPRLPANIILLRNRSVIGVDWGDWARTDDDAAVAVVADVVRRIGRGELHPPRPQVFPLADAGKVLLLFMDRAVTGKIALLPG